MAVYYKEKSDWLRISLDSIFAQTYVPSEVVIVKDGPLNAELDSVLDEYEDAYKEKIKIVALPENGGLGKALAAGLKVCTNEYIVRADTDDYSKPDRVEKQLKAMEAHSADVISCYVSEFDRDMEHPDKIKAVPVTHEEIMKYGRRRNPFNHPAVVFRKSRALHAGGYRHAPWIEDYDLWIRMLMDGSRGYNLEEPLVCMRVNSDTYMRRGGREYLKSMKAFNRKYYKAGWFSFADYMVRTSANILVALSTNRLRDIIYKKFLRKQSI